jgi:hypothetical protein
MRSPRKRLAGKGERVSELSHSKLRGISRKTG